MSSDTSGGDLRAGLSVPERSPINKAAQYFEFSSMEPNVEHESGSRTWLVRSQSMVVAYTEGVAGDTFRRAGQPDEYVVLNWGEGPEGAGGCSVTCSAGEQTETAVDPSFIVMPPGDSEVTLTSDGALVRLFTTRSTDLTAQTANDAVFAEPDPYVAPFVSWPDPVGGFKIRTYRLADYERDPKRLGRLFRCTTFMVNAFHEFDKPRPANKMSPHFHEDFEQISMTLAGDFMHHIRSPWTTDLDEWIPDEHRACSSPSVTVIPPPAIHGSRWFEGTSQLLDIFAPPRHDFSSKDGWVLNAEEYPLP